MATIKVGDQVTVPGDMYGTVKFVGMVAGKNGTFAGVQLAPDFAHRGKNSGDVEGKHYFRTTVPGAGIFLPLDKAAKRPGTGRVDSTGSAGPRASPHVTPTKLGTFNQGGRTPALPKPNFSQSVGPAAIRAGAASPSLKPPLRRESLPRPTSPLRKVNTPVSRPAGTPKTRPSIGMNRSQLGGPGTYNGNTGPRQSNKFSQSLRQPSKAPVQQYHSPLGPESNFDEIPEDEPEPTPTPTPYMGRNGGGNDEDTRRLREMLDEKDRELQEQARSIIEMERNLNELQKLMPELSGSGRGRGLDDEEDLPRDVVSLRAALREKNEKVRMLTAEFDANRADFRSTIDTLEMASTETERVYEKRVDELLEEVRSLQDRSEDVESVAQQLKQLEELVQELEEGLEDARRGEAEARGEVEFLRGEVERSRSELRRERDRKRTEEQLNGYGAKDGEDKWDELQSKLVSKDDEIRGLKVIIRNLNKDPDSPQTPKANANGANRGHYRNDSAATDEGLDLQKQIHDLETLLQQKTAHEEELENEVNQLRQSVQLSSFPLPGSAFGLRSGGKASHSRDNSWDMKQKPKHQSVDTVGSQRTIVLSPLTSGQNQEWPDPPAARNESPLKQHLEVEREADSDNYYTPEASSDAAKSDVGTIESSSVLWCEICEENGHDILNCSKMFSQQKKQQQQQQQQPQNQNHNHSRSKPGSFNANRFAADRPAPLMSRKTNLSNAGSSADQALPSPTFSQPLRSPTYEQPLQSPTYSSQGQKDKTSQPSSLSRTNTATATTPSAPTLQDEIVEEEDDGYEDEPITSISPNTTYTDNNSPPTAHDKPSIDDSNNTASKEPGNKQRDPKAPVEGTGDQAGMWAGKSSGVIDPNKWCALCERDGHDSVDCPIEDAF